jgi:hypothetical protein
MQGATVLDSFTVAVGAADGAAEIADNGEAALRRALDALHAVG